MQLSHTRLRRVNPKGLDAIGRMAAQGQVARTGAKIVRALALAFRRRVAKDLPSDGLANRAQTVRVKRYREKCREVLSAERVAAIAGEAPPRALAAAVHDSAAAFAHTGDPGWRPWSEAPGTTRATKTNCTPRTLGPGPSYGAPEVSSARGNLWKP